MKESFIKNKNFKSKSIDPNDSIFGCGDPSQALMNSKEIKRLPLLSEEALNEIKHQQETNKFNSKTFEKFSKKTSIFSPT
jgi:hypothetical protein